MRNLFSILIFLSLAIAIGVIGRHLPEIKSYFQKKKRFSWGKFLFIPFFLNLGKKIGGVFLSLAESGIKRFKNLLHLAHFWLIKIRKRKQQNEELREIEAKMELLEEEEKNLEKVINDDLGREEEDALSEREALAEQFKKKPLMTEEDFQEEIIANRDGAEPILYQKEETTLEIEDEEGTTTIKEEETFVSERNSTMDQQINQFFSSEGSSNSEEGAQFEDEADQQEEVIGEESLSEEELKKQLEEEEEEKRNLMAKKKNFFSRFTDKFKLGSFKKKPEWEKYFPPAESEEDPAGYGGEFSDGIVEVGEISEETPQKDFYQEENNLIKEVVKVAKKKEEYSDEDLGVDREILERKIIAKISSNPKDQENYRQLGDLYLKMENFRDAEECYRQVLKIKPRDMGAKRKLERVRLLKRLRHR